MKNKAAQTDAAAPRGEDFDPDEIPAEDLTLTYRIEEGRQYRVGTVSVEGNTFFSTDDLMNELTLKSKMVEIFDQIDLKMVKADGLQEGEIYSVNSLQASIETLQNKYGRRGFREGHLREPRCRSGRPSQRLDGAAAAGARDAECPATGRNLQEERQTFSAGRR